MKFIRLVGNFYKKNGFVSLLLFVILTFSLVFMSEAFGVFRYITFTRDTYTGSGLVDCYWFMPLVDTYQGSDEKVNAAVQDIFNQAAEIDGVEELLTLARGSLLYYEGGPTFYQVMNPAMAQNYRPKLTGGKWLTDSFEAPAGTVPAVAAGPVMKNAKVGDTITGYIFDKRLAGQGKDTAEMVQEVQFYIIGTMGEFGYIPDFSSSGGQMTTQDFLQPAGNLIILETPAVYQEILRNDPARFLRPNCFVRLAGGLTPDQKAECLNRLSYFGSTVDSEEILKNTDTVLNIRIKTILPFPLFAIAVSTFCFFSLSVLFVRKKMSDTTVYALCGCSKRKNFAIMATGLGGIGLLAVLVTGVLIVLYPAYKYKIPENYRAFELYFDYQVYLCLFGYLLLMLIISLAVPFLARRKMSPIELYRRKTQ